MKTGISIRGGAGRAGAAAAAVLLSVAAYWSMRLAWAERLAAGECAAGAARAARLAPGNARYWLRLAEGSGNPRAALERAAAASPYDSSIRLRLGLQWELEGDYAAAERHLAAGAALSRLYEPRWTLANYYFRRGNQDEFWRWTHSALGSAYGDRAPLFRLAWEQSRDASLILRRAVGEDPLVLRAYAEFLLSTGRLEAAEGCVAKLVRAAGPESRAILLAYIGRMMGQRRMDAALAAWNGMCARELVPYRPLDAAAGRSLTNGDFARPPLNAGFDWVVESPPGVWAAALPGRLRISFSGRQPENCPLLAQYAPVAPGRAYALGCAWESEDMAPEAGLRWSVRDAAGGAELAAGWPPGAAGGRLRFAVPHGTAWVRVELVHRRAPGTTRMQGTLALRGVTLEEER